MDKIKNEYSNNEKDNFVIFDSKVLSSSHINFLFGAGVNGDSFPQVKGFVRTNEKLKRFLGKGIENFEEDLSRIQDQEKVNLVLDEFIQEFKEFNDKINFEGSSIKNIEFLFEQINRLIIESENRTVTTKQVNIYTLNYDTIVEKVLLGLGYLVNVVSSSNIDNHDKFFNLVGYNYNLKKYIPTYLISKIHGDIENPVLPSKNKYDETLMAKRFEILFKMKEQLSKMNGILIVIGYSGRDKHINRLLKDCISSGLTIYWYRYNKKEKIPDELENRIFIIDQVEEKNPVNSTKICYEMVKELWEKQSVE